MESPLILMALLGLYIPAATAIIFTARSDRHRPLRDLWQRLINPRLIRPGGYALIFLTIPLLTLAATGVDQLLGGNSGWSQTAIGVAGNPLMLLGLVVLLLLLGALSEEIGWRSYLLDALQQHLPPLAANFCLGILWAAWLIPLFFMPGMIWHDSVGFLTPAFWRFTLSLVAISGVYGAVYNRCGRSLLSKVIKPSFSLK